MSEDPAEVVGTVTTPMRFEEFFAQHHRAVVAVVRPLVEGPAAAEDVAQEAFASAHARWARIRRYDRPDLWVRRVAINRAIGAGRKRRSETKAIERLTRFGVEQTAFDTADHAAHPDSALWAAVAALPRRQAQLVALVYVDDQSIETAAELLGLSASTARTHLQRARQSLATALSLPTNDHKPSGEVR